MNKLFSFAIPGLLLGFGLTASANTLSIDNAATIQAGSYGGGYGGEFPGTFNGNPIEVYCVDFTQDFTSGQTYTVHVNTPTSSTFTTQTHYGGYTGAWEYDNGTYNAVQRYEMSGWLASQLSSSKTQGTNDALQEAIWTLLDANIALAPYSCAGESASACQTAVTNDVSTAAADYASFITDHTISIYTDVTAGCVWSGTTAPTASGCMQEMISVTSSAVPESSSMVLMGIGGALIGLGALRRRKTTRN
jgi:hypothetical protein